MALDASDVKYIAKLANLDPSDDKVAALQKDLNNILDMLTQMDAVDTTGVEPLSNPNDAVQRLRADVVTESNQRDALQEGAPATKDGMYVVPIAVEQK